MPPLGSFHMPRAVGVVTQPMTKNQTLFPSPHSPQQPSRIRGVSPRVGDPSRRVPPPSMSVSFQLDRDSPATSGQNNKNVTVKTPTFGANAANSLGSTTHPHGISVIGTDARNPIQTIARKPSPTLRFATSRSYCVKCLMLRPFQKIAPAYRPRTRIF